MILIKQTDKCKKKNVRKIKRRRPEEGGLMEIKKTGGEGLDHPAIQEHAICREGNLGPRTLQDCPVEWSLK